MIISIYKIEELEAWEDVEYYDIPEEAWEFKCNFDLTVDDLEDITNFYFHLKKYYLEGEALAIVHGLLTQEYWYDYTNGFKYTLGWD